MPATLTYTGELTIVSCWCGIKLAVPEDLYRWAKKNSANAIHCPLGHTFVYRETAAAALRKELAATRQTAAQDVARAERRATSERAARDQAEAAADHARRQAAGYKGHLTRVRRRITNGVCPVPGCKRSGFTKVMAHIASQHPDWLAEHEDLHA